MTAREVVTLNESTPQLEAPQSGDTYYLVRDVVCATGSFSSEVADGATAVAFDFDTDNAYATSGAKLLSLKNNGAEAFRVDYAGTARLTNVSGGATLTIAPGSTSTITGSGGVHIGRSGYTVGIGGNESDGNGETQYQEHGIFFLRNSGGQTFDIKPGDATGDWVTGSIKVQGQSAYASSTTNLVGGDLTLSGGNGASGSAGDAHGGDVTIRGGTGYGTGDDGLVLMTNLPTSDPSVAGALWNNSGVLTVSSG